MPEKVWNIYMNADPCKGTTSGDHVLEYEGSNEFWCKQCGKLFDAIQDVDGWDLEELDSDRKVIIRQDGNLRFIRHAGKYSAQAYVGFLWWKKWKNISFGPFYPMKPGTSRFQFYEIAQQLYHECLPGGKFTEFGTHWRSGV